MQFVSEFITTFRWREHRLPIMAISLALVVAITGLILVYLADVLDLSSAGDVRGLWWHIYRNRGPVEWGQWFFLSLTALTSAHLGGIARERGESGATVFWTLVAVSFILMMIEDAGDPRHFLAHYATRLLDIRKLYVEGAVFAVIVFPLLYAFIRYGRVIFSRPQTRLYIISGVFLYAVAAGTSLFRESGSFYYVVGDALSERFTGGAIPGFFLMDFVLEETVELLASAIFYAGVLAYLVTTRVPRPSRGDDRVGDLK